MTEAEIFAKTCQHIGEYLELDVSHIRRESLLTTVAPSLDSLKIFEMMLYLEDCFGVSFDESEMGDVKTVQDVVGYIKKVLDQKAFAHGTEPA